jgi:hypothetical protein
MTVKARVKNRFIFSSDVLLSEDEAMEIQKDMGFNPCGYGFYDFNGRSWFCYDSCD